MRKIIKRSVVVLLAGVLLFSLSGCKKKQKKDEVQRYAWPLGTSSPEDTVTQLYAEKFAKEVSRLSHGKMKIEVYPNSTLGGDRELLESCKDGDIPFVVQNTAPQVTFLPDKTIFDDWIYDYDTLRTRLRETAFLTKGLKITLTDLRVDPPKERHFHYEGGIKEFVTYLNKGKTPLYPDIIYCEGMKDNIYVEVAMQHNDGYTEGPTVL